MSQSLQPKVVAMMLRQLLTHIIIRLDTEEDLMFARIRQWALVAMLLITGKVVAVVVCGEVTSVALTARFILLYGENRSLQPAQCPPPQV